MPEKTSVSRTAGPKVPVETAPAAAIEVEGANRGFSSPVVVDGGVDSDIAAACGLDDRAGVGDVGSGSGAGGLQHPQPPALASFRVPELSMRTPEPRLMWPDPAWVMVPALTKLRSRKTVLAEDGIDSVAVEEIWVVPVPDMAPAVQVNL